MINGDFNIVSFPHSRLCIFSKWIHGKKHKWGISPRRLSRDKEKFSIEKSPFVLNSISPLELTKVLYRSISNWRSSTLECYLSICENHQSGNDVCTYNCMAHKERSSTRNIPHAILREFYATTLFYSLHCRHVDNYVMKEHYYVTSVPVLWYINTMICALYILRDVISDYWSRVVHFFSFYV